MDFGNPKKVEIFNDLHPILGFEAFEGGRGGGVANRYRLCDTPSEAKVPS